MKQNVRLPKKQRLSFHSVKASTSVELKEAATDASAGVSSDALKRFSMVAYTGQKMVLEGVPLPVVFDLGSMKQAKSVPLLFDHMPREIVGHNEQITIHPTMGVSASGVISGTNERSKEIVTLATNKFPWQLSLGLMPGQVDLYEQGEELRANGRVFVGPLYHARDGLIREISFCSMGADSNTLATMLASLKGSAMTYEEWLVSMGLDPTTITPEQDSVLKIVYEALPDDPPAETPAETPAEGTNTGTTTNANTGNNVNAGVNVVTIMRAQASTERARIDSIGVLAAKYGNPSVGTGAAQTYIANTAVKDGWTVVKTELEMLKASRGNTIDTGAGADEGERSSRFQVFEAALAQAGKISKPERYFSPQTLDLAHKRFKSRLGLQEMLYEGARLNGYRGPMNFKANMAAILRANFSTNEIPALLSNNVNKYLLEGYESVDDSYKKIAATGSVTNFQEVTGLRMGENLIFEKVAPDGKIPHGQLTEESYGNKADTWAKMLSVTRQDMINDNLGAITGIPKKLGRGGILALVRAVWVEFMNNAAFFTAGNGNVTAGALSAAGLGTMFAAFRKLKDPSGNFVMATPRFLVVPVELEVQAETLRTSTNVVGGSTPVPDGNIWAGKFETVSSPYLSDPSIVGNSAIAHYLLADPNDMPVIEIVFLDGVETPQVETAEMDFNMLGIQMRGVFDYGVRKQNPRGGVRSTGA